MLNLEISNRKIENFFHNSKDILKRKKEVNKNLINGNVKRGSLKELFEDLEND